jgi:trimeric autotransporter adhesin
MKNNLSVICIQTNTSIIKKVGAGLFLIAVHAVVLAQSVGIGTTTPNASAQLDITSTSKEILVPRMTTAKGLLAFDGDTNSFWFYKGTVWTELTLGGH